jgi:uncharacterized protein
MKHTFLCLLAALLVAGAGAVPARAAGVEITVSGIGSASRTPDVATVSAVVMTNAATASDASSQNNQTYYRVVAALVKLGVARDDIVLGYYNVEYVPPPLSMPPNPTGERYGYTVSRTLVVKVREIDKAGAVTDTCIDSGATSINNVHFGLSDPSEARAEAIAKGVAAARHNAESLARAASLRIVSIKSIELLNGGFEGGGPMIARAMSSGGRVPTDFDQTSVNISVSVTMVFVAEP